MRFLITFAAALVSAAVVAFLILPLGLEASWAVPMALLIGALASGMGAWLADGRRGRLAPVLAASLASLVLAVPVGAVLFFVVGTNVSISVPIVLAVVAAASTFAVRRFPGPANSTSGPSGLAKIVSAIAVLVVLVVLLYPVGKLGFTWLTACMGEDRAVFEEFPQYSPRAPEELDPKPDAPDAVSALGSACIVSYRTPDVPTEVLDYFAARLEENGWEMRSSNIAALYARRGDYEYQVSFSGDPTSRQEGTPVTVIVREP